MIQLLDIDSRILAREIDDSHPGRLLNMPKVIRVGDFDEQAVMMFSHLISEAHRTGQPLIPIVIDSNGGDVYALWSMVDILDRATLPIATIIEGKAMSCGAALFTCGTQGLRFVGPNATMMIHDVASGAEGKTEDIKVMAHESERLNKKLYSFMEKRINVRRGTLWRRVHDRGRSDWYLTPQEAVKLNIANHIKIPSFRTSVSVTMALEY